MDWISKMGVKRPVNKGDLIDLVAKHTESTKASAGKAVDAIFESITGALAKGEKVALVGFGTFLVKKRKARIGINPKTKEKINIPAKKVPAFKPGAELKSKVLK
jgi:DNA-binding protein HU-beta